MNVATSRGSGDQPIGRHDEWAGVAEIPNKDYELEHSNDGHRPLR